MFTDQNSRNVEKKALTCARVELDAGAEVKVAQLHRGEAVGVHAQNVLWLEVPENYDQ